MTKEHAQTCPNVSEHEKKIGATKRDQTRLNATKRDLARSNTLANARNCIQTLVTAYTGKPDLRAPHIACKRFRNPDVVEISPPFWDALLRRFRFLAH